MVKMHFRSSWVEAMEAFTDVTKLVEAFSLETVLWCHEIQIQPMGNCRQISVLIILMTCLVTDTYKLKIKDEPITEGSNSVGVGTLKSDNIWKGTLHWRWFVVYIGSVFSRQTDQQTKWTRKPPSMRFNSGIKSRQNKFYSSSCLWCSHKYYNSLIQENLIHFPNSILQCLQKSDDDEIIQIGKRWDNNFGTKILS